MNLGMNNTLIKALTVLVPTSSSIDEHLVAVTT